MVLRIFMSGPIRPTESSVRSAILSIRSQFPDARVSLCTWKTSEDTSKIQAEVDEYIEVEEPDTEFIRQQITVSTLTDTNYDCAPKGWNVTTYKMMKGIATLFETFPPAEDDIVIRIRTDCIVRFPDAYRQGLLQTASKGYCVWFARFSGVSFNDWFAIASARIMKLGWVVSSMEEYNASIKGRYNPEEVIKYRLLNAGVSLCPLDMTKTDIYLLRPTDKGYVQELRCPD
jgi:hypothetical protein